MAAPVSDRTIIRHIGQHELAQRWCISPRTLERWRWIGEGPAFLKIGARVAYRLEDVEAYEAEQRRTPATQRDEVE
ncbi:helix-turn-helix transcriptional regulator [Roseomonas xinghualingensis]|uniref:helix-turn-helix transcriptional regulator n=1 Tax=Roseomonas xinghualingensis TaxID=2986475 RepID=UPI0021F0D06E|nr:helix-turn-helix domain-containing protein [Roseomonas sp. SXEYE001]MCV4209756.1 helix-turn-helix domain-containing protein [Roseomonas sp. SXEYE001]